MSIIVNQLSYVHPDREILFENLSFHLNKGEKVALLGKNGTGKSTLLKIISGQLQPTKGEIISNSTLYYIPQHFGQYNDFTIAKALGIEDKIKALHQILEGDASEHNFEILGDEWEIEEKAISVLASWSLEHLNLTDSMSTLSGGEKTKVFLAGISLHSPDFVIMDEPSNHLDIKGREALYHFIKTTSVGLLIVSHDRVLLNLLNFTLELTKRGINAYGGNYEFYKEQYNEQLNALAAQLEEKEKQLRKAKQTAKEVLERKQKNDGRGEKRSFKKGLPRILMNAKESMAENSTSQLKEAHTNKIKNMAEEIKSIREETPDMKKLKFTLGKSELYLGKILITFENVNFGYSSKMLWQNPLNFQIKSGDRIVISGNNGTGKTTILKLILGNLSPTTGMIKKADFKSLYVDQEYSLISQNHLTVYEQVQVFNTRNFEESELKMLLHHFLFMPDMWDKTCDKLSGGEKMKLLFCCMFVNDNNPDILILDEPTNNLDIDSLQVMASILKEYKGTIIIISHDIYFKEEIGVTQTIDL